jgi:hypothetical protein
MRVERVSDHRFLGELGGLVHERVVDPFLHVDACAGNADLALYIVAVAEAMRDYSARCSIPRNKLVTYIPCWCTWPS